MAKVFNMTTNKNGLFVYAGEASADYGMVIAEAPAFERGKRKTTVYNVPGRNGSVIVQQDAWEDVPRAYKVWLTVDGKQALNEAVDAVEAWLNSVKGYQRLEDNFEPEIFRLAYYNGGDEFSNMAMMAGEGTLRFTCRAERFYKSGEQAITVTNGTKIYNPTRYTSKPLIHIEGSGTVTVSIGGNTISANVTDYINIDSDTMNAYRLPAENKNGDISGSFPVIPAGAQTIGITGTTTKVTVVPRWFTI
ncbi:MAG: hypothetical protein J6S14_13970 [Clostridia bacterium]|nr:hypothetical protein [Clostridia bacterium]